MAVDASPTFFSVTLTSSVSSFGAEKRFPASVTIADLKVSGFVLPSSFLINAHPTPKGETGADHWSNLNSDAAATV